MSSHEVLLAADAYSRPSRFACQECGQCFPTRRALFVHDRTHAQQKASEVRETTQARDGA